jgi:hypothetical protein
MALRSGTESAALLDACRILTASDGETIERACASGKGKGNVPSPADLPEKPTKIMGNPSPEGEASERHENRWGEGEISNLNLYRAAKDLSAAAKHVLHFGWVNDQWVWMSRHPEGSLL